MKSRDRRTVQALVPENLLVERAKGGDRKAMSTLLERHYEDMLKVALRYTRDVDRARDALHESCLKVIQNLSQFRGECRFASWMARIVINCARLQYRHQNRFVPLNMDTASQRPSNSPDPERAAVDRENLDRTINRLRIGRAGDENLFWRRFVMGQSLRIISQDLGVSEPSLKTRVHRARIRLKHAARLDNVV